MGGCRAALRARSHANIPAQARAAGNPQADSAASRTVLQVFRGPSAGVALKIAWDAFSSTLAYLMGCTRSFDPIPQVDGTKYASVLENVSQGTRARTPWATLGYTVETRTHPVGTCELARRCNSHKPCAQAPSSASGGAS